MERKHFGLVQFPKNLAEDWCKMSVEVVKKRIERNRSDRWRLGMKGKSALKKHYSGTPETGAAGCYRRQGQGHWRFGQGQG